MQLIIRITLSGPCQGNLRKMSRGTLNNLINFVLVGAFILSVCLCLSLYFFFLKPKLRCSSSNILVYLLFSCDWPSSSMQPYVASQAVHTCMTLGENTRINKIFALVLVSVMCLRVARNAEQCSKEQRIMFFNFFY